MSDCKLAPDELTEWEAQQNRGLCRACGLPAGECRVAPTCYARTRSLEPRRWRSWFDGETYLGVSSARTGPDDVGAHQHCLCSQCRPEGA